MKRYRKEKVKKQPQKQKVIKINLSMFIGAIIGFIVLITAATSYEIIKTKIATNTSTLNTSQKYRATSEEDEEEEAENTSNYSKAYLDYLELSDEEKSSLSVIPRKYNVSLNMLYEETAVESSATSSSEEIAESFDLRDEIEIDTKDQGDLGLCYAFASLRSVQTNLLLNGYDNYDFSELHFAFMAFDGFSGESYTYGGNFWYFESVYLAGGYGPVLEEDMPYDSEYTEDDYDYICNLDSVVYVTETVDFPTIDKVNETYTDDELETFRDTVKQHIMENGSVYASIDAYSDDAYEYSIQEINSYYTLYSDYNYAEVDHAISVIGWDDNFSRDNFKSIYTNNVPDNDGAWIAINSWGEEYEIIYISYEDLFVEQEMSGVVSVTLDVNEASKDIQFEDENLYDSLKDALKKGVTSYDDENLTLTCINSSVIDVLDLSGQSIGSLTGIENFENLEYLYLDDNNITDISNLSALTSLLELSLSENQIEDVSKLSNLTNLEYLYLNDNNIEDASELSNLTNLWYLNISYNEISDLSFLEKLDSLFLFNLRYNNITDISDLEFLVDNEEGFLLGYGDEDEYYVSVLDLSGNPLTEGFEVITTLGYYYEICLDECEFDDSIIETLSNLDLEELEELSLEYNDITDVSNLNIDGLTVLYLSGNQNLDTSTIPLGLEYLYLDDCNISDISFLKDFTGSYLSLNYDPIEDISILAEIEESEWALGVSLRGANITDVSCLGDANSYIYYLDLSENENLTGLEELPSTVGELYLQDCNLEDISFLENYEGLDVLYLNDNNITDISYISDLTNLYELNLENNLIEEIPDLSNLEYLYYLDLSYNNIQTLNTSKFPSELYGVILKGNLLTEVPESTENCYIDLSENYISEVVDEYNTYVLESQQINITYSDESINTFDMPSILAEAYETRYKNYYLGYYNSWDIFNGYEAITTFDVEECSLDFDTGIITLESTEDVATINIDGGKYNGTVVTISYSESVDLVSISVETVPTKTEYTEGETFDSTGMVVIATYNDETTQEITDYEISPSGKLSTSDTYITISYTENGVTATTTQSITVTASNTTDDDNSSDTEDNNTSDTNETNTNNTDNEDSNNTTNDSNNSSSSGNSTNTNTASTTSSSADDSSSSSSLPYTGSTLIKIGILIVLGAIAIFSYTRYKEIY